MPSVRREVVLPVPRAEAWALLTGDDAIREWLAEDAVLEPEVGGEVRADGRRGVVEAVDEGRRLTFRWDDGIDEARVEWTLSEDEAVDAIATRVVVVERRLDPVLAAAWAPKLSALARASALCLA